MADTVWRITFPEHVTLDSPVQMVTTGESNKGRAHVNGREGKPLASTAGGVETAGVCVCKEGADSNPGLLTLRAGFTPPTKSEGQLQARLWSVAPTRVHPPHLGRSTVVLDQIRAMCS